MDTRNTFKTLDASPSLSSSSASYSHLSKRHALSKITASILGLSMLSAAPYAIADTASDEEKDIERIEVIGQPNKFGALKSDTPLLETARSVSIETSQQFYEKGALTLDDSLTYSAGVVADAYGFSTRGDFIKIRGFDAPEYRDGMQSLSGNYNNTRPELYTLEQVEVLKGPASVLFGPGSPGGIVNIITKRPGTKTDNEVVMQMGSFDRQQIATDLNYSTDDNFFDARFVGLYRQGDTQIEQINDDSLVLAPSFKFNLSDVTQITILTDYAKRDSDSAHQFLPISGSLTPTASGQTIDPLLFTGQPGFNQYDTESWSVSLLAEHQLNETWAFDLSSRYRDGESTYKQAWVSFTGTGNPRFDAAGNGARSWYQANGQSEQFQFDARARANFDTGEIEHRMLIGASHQKIDNRTDKVFVYGYDRATGMPVGGIFNVFNPTYENVDNIIEQLPEPITGTPTQDNILGLYIHNEMTYNNFIVNAGIRYDEVEKEENSGTSNEYATSISLSALYHFDIGLSPYINFSESFTPVVGVDSTTEQAMRSQEGEQWEAGVKYQPQNTSHYMTLAYFDIELSNLPNPNALPYVPASQQEGVSTVTGVEFEANLVFNNWKAEINLSALDSEEQNGFQRSSIPDQQASIWVRHDFAQPALEGLYTGFGARYIGESESTDINRRTSEYLTVTTPSYTVLDLTVGYQLTNWDLTLSARNLTDKQYYATCLARGDCYPGEKRSIAATASYRF
ncbi:TonB-dependent siderophore receptor [Flocculibacter collagenilyticus]|uniref:TonB-dependent siderophore receptor n=1 Tax=Flocculibacter collagenilyticus TaxID=2744479 RepID=UPI0018F7AE15|nr:TonB-dependent siderophore receptor [Flocculibacter collagenilyticus]